MAVRTAAQWVVQWVAPKAATMAVLTVAWMAASTAGQWVAKRVACWEPTRVDWSAEN